VPGKVLGLLLNTAGRRTMRRATLLSTPSTISSSVSSVPVSHQLACPPATTLLSTDPNHHQHCLLVTNPPGVLHSLTQPMYNPKTLAKELEPYQITTLQDLAGSFHGNVAPTQTGGWGEYRSGPYTEDFSIDHVAYVCSFTCIQRLALCCVHVCWC